MDSEGNVKFFVENKGYGFITGDDGLDYFFHVSECAEEVREGDAVKFTAGSNDKGRNATNIRR